MPTAHTHKALQPRADREGRTISAAPGPWSWACVSSRRRGGRCCTSSSPLILQGGRSTHHEAADLVSSPNDVTEGSKEAQTPCPAAHWTLLPGRPFGELGQGCCRDTRWAQQARGTGEDTGGSSHQLRAWP